MRASDFSVIRSGRARRWAARPAGFWIAVALLFLTGVLYGLSYSLTGVGIAGGIPLTSFVLLMGMAGPQWPCCSRSAKGDCRR